MKIGVLIPTRGDRVKFLAQANKLLSKQTMKPHEVNIVNFKPSDGNKDITKRYRIGCNELFNEKKCDLVIFWEDDDWYSNDYIETIFNSWISNGKPDIIGFGKTIYYHLFVKNYLVINHPTRASACCTAVTKEILNTKFPDDTYPYLDMEIWAQINKKYVINTERFYHVGIKHGIGLVGGGGHPENWRKYQHKDGNLKFLSSIVDSESLEFYKNYKN